MKSGTLDALVEMEAESMERPHPHTARATPAVHKVMNAYCDAAYNLLYQLVPEIADILWSDYRADYLILMTLRGEGVGIWDGSWDEPFKRTFGADWEEALKATKQGLKAGLSEWADDTGGGKVNDALMTAAEDTT